MAQVIRIKRRAAGGAAGAPSSLAGAEPAYNEQDDVLYYGKGDSGGTATSVVPIGGKGAFTDLSSAQTIVGAKTFSTSPIVPTATSTDSTTKAASTAFVQAQFPSVTGATKAKVTYNAKGLITAGADLTAGDIPTLTASKISDFATQVQTSRLDQMAAPTADLSINSKKLINVADPANAQDAATKYYVDSVVQGFIPRDAVDAATTASITLSAVQTIDGVTGAVGKRILVKNQTDAAQNGIYLQATGAWTRSTDMDAWSEFRGASVFVQGGTVNGSTGWCCTAPQTGTLNTTAVTWTQTSAPGSYTNGTGLTLSGTQFSISTSYTGQSSITTLGTIGTGTWQGTSVGLNYGGTGANLSGLSNGALIKKNGSALIAAVADTDYLNSSSPIDGGTF